MPQIQIATPFHIDLEFEIAPISKRLLAYAIDFAILLLFFTSMKYFYYGGFNLAGNDRLQSNAGLDILTISLPMLLYSLVFEAGAHGQTIGKKILNIRVISLDGGSPTLGQFILRWMFKVFEWPFFFGYTVFTVWTMVDYVLITGFLGIGVLIVLAINRKNQRLGDLAANTVVINTRSSFSVADTVFMEITEKDYVVTFPEVFKLSDRDINTIKNVVNLYHKNRDTLTTDHLSLKVQEVLNIQTDLDPVQFLETLLSDYNYLANQ